MTSNTIYVAVDIEKAGKAMDDAIMAIGLCAGNASGTVLDKKLWCLDFPAGKGIEEQCRQEFWSKYPDLLQFIANNARPIGEVMKEFVQFLDDLESRFGANNITFVSDNPAFDIGSIDYYLHTYAGRFPMRYTKAGKYRCIEDPSERLDMLVNKSRIYFEIDKIANHNHKPDNDAEYIYRMQIEANKYKRLNWWDWMVIQTKEAVGSRFTLDRIVNNIWNIHI